MGPSRRRLISSISLVLLLSTSYAWAHDGAGNDKGSRRVAVDGERQNASPVEAAPLWRRLGAEIVDAVEEQVVRVAVKERRQDSIHGRGTRTGGQAGDVVARAEITPAARLPECSVDALLKRQNQAQINQLSNSIQQFSQASQQISQASQQISQASQQLSQASQRISQSLQQATISLQQQTQSVQQLQQSVQQLQQSTQQLQQSAQQASQSAQQASQALQQASQSASSAISSVQSSASQAIAANLASATSSASMSASSLIAAASSSASAIMSSASSVVQQALAQVTGVREQADSQVAQAQGAAVSVTQAALAIVGAIVGSSVLTMIAVWLWLRYRRLRRRRENGGSRSGSGSSRRASSLSGASSNPSRADISYPRSVGGTGYYGGGYGYGAYDADLKGEVLQTPRRPPEVAAAVSGGVGSEDEGERRGLGFLRGLQRGINGNGNRGKPKKIKFGLFPRPRGTNSPAAKEMAEADATTVGGSQRGSTATPPSLDAWLRAGAVSPFGVLEEEPGEPDGKGTDWPFGKDGPSSGSGGGSSDAARK